MQLLARQPTGQTLLCTAALLLFRHIAEFFQSQFGQSLGFFRPGAVVRAAQDFFADLEGKPVKSAAVEHDGDDEDDDEKGDKHGVAAVNFDSLEAKLMFVSFRLVLFLAQHPDSVSQASCLVIFLCANTQVV